MGVGRSLRRLARDACGAVACVELVKGNLAAQALYRSEGFEVVLRPERDAERLASVLMRHIR